MDEILTRMDEFESSISIVSENRIALARAGKKKHDGNICHCCKFLIFQIRNISTVTSLPDIMECKKGIQQYSERIDKIQIMLDRINTDIGAMEQNMDKAEEDLGFNNTGIKGFFKPLLGKIAKNRTHSQELVDHDTSATYKPVDAFKATDYFGESSSCDLLDEADDDKWENKNRPAAVHLKSSNENTSGFDKFQICLLFITKEKENETTDQNINYQY